MAELEDRLAPDLGLDDNGSLLLDFGPRQFTVSFDETLKPFVRDASGSRLKDLPKPNKSDDESRADEAVNRYKLLKKDARTVAAQQVASLNPPCACAAAGHQKTSSSSWLSTRWFAT
ncbi:putative nucleic acid binding protein (putative regulator) [Escherichia coli]|nr:putative nucleic acid binding protein (putative regulator) [Escherichia coli]